MYNKIKLPRISAFRLSGFSPIFEKEIRATLKHGPFGILGGNGMGKTTIIQAIVYGLAGGSNNENIEEQRIYRWDHRYFQDRLAVNQLCGNTEIEVEFSFGSQFFSVRRGIRGDNVTAFRSGDDDWVDTPSKAQDAFLNCITELGGYKNENDFAYLVHRLLYLPESRQLIAWDLDAQVRILMMLNQDIISEEDFRKRRSMIKEMDSDRRHIHVALVKIANKNTVEGGSLDSTEEQNEGSQQGPIGNLDYKTEIVPLASMLDSLDTQIYSRMRLTNNVREKLSTVSEEIAELREKNEQVEGRLVNDFLENEEHNLDMIIHKLLISGVCPVCGSQNLETRAIAQKNNQNHKCVFCGSDKSQTTYPDFATLQSQMAEKIRSQKSLERDFLTSSNQLAMLQTQAEDLRIQINELRLQEPKVNLVERYLPDLVNLNSPYRAGELEKKQANLLVTISQEKKLLSSDYEAFRESIEARMNRLRSSYREYATRFLGLDCDLREQSSTPTANDIVLPRFVPFFEDILRDTPDSCSESQRFFLDIAFRMALIEYASSSEEDKATFICETPENSLDISYVANVAGMFKQFCNSGFSVIFTTNIQENGFAKEVLDLIPVQNKTEHILNMLEVGKQSKVQINASDQFNEIVRSILS